MAMHNRPTLPQAIKSFAYAVTESVKRNNKTSIDREYQAAKRLLRFLGVTNPTPQEIDACIPG